MRWQVLVLCLGLAIGQSPLQLQLTLTSPEGMNYSVYAEGQLNNTFNDSAYNNTLCCTTGDLFILELKKDTRVQTSFLTSNMPLEPTQLAVYASPNQSPKPTLIPLSQYGFEIQFNCPTDPTNDDYYNKVVVVVNDIYPFSFMLDCDQGVRHKKFEVGYIVIAAMNSIIILGVALHSRIWSYRFRERELGVVVSWKWMLPAIVIFAGLAVLAQQLDAFTQTASIFGAILATFCLIICLNELLFLVNALKKPVVAFVRWCDIISVTLAIITVVLIELETYDFITNDFLAVCIVIALIKLFKFSSLKEAVICCGFLMVIETLAAIIYHYASPDQSYNDVFGRDIVSPLILQIPSFRSSLYKKCSWLATTQVIFPGVAISYLRRYEFAREGKRVYLIVANAAFCLSTIVWIFAEAVYAHTLPFALIAYPGMFITVILLGVYMNDLKVIWNARFYDPQISGDKDIKEALIKTDAEQILVQADLEGLKYSSGFSSKSGGSQIRLKKDEAKDKSIIE